MKQLFIQGLLSGRHFIFCKYLIQQPNNFMRDVIQRWFPYF